MLRLTFIGFQALKELGIEMEVYCASEIDEQAMQVGSDILYTRNIFGKWRPSYPRGSYLGPLGFFQRGIGGGGGGGGGGRQEREPWERGRGKLCNGPRSIYQILTRVLGFKKLLLCLVLFYLY